MGYSIPVIYLACEQAELPATLSRWTDAAAVISHADANRSKYHMHMATARNWWQLLAITDVRDRENLPGLEFCDGEIGLLAGNDFEAAINSIDRVLAAHIEAGNINRDALPSLPLAEPDIDCERPDGLSAFLRSLKSVIQFARDHSLVFLFVQPQP